MPNLLPARKLSARAGKLPACPRMAIVFQERSPSRSKAPETNFLNLLPSSIPTCVRAREPNVASHRLVKRLRFTFVRSFFRRAPRSSVSPCRSFFPLRTSFGYRRGYRLLNSPRLSTKSLFMSRERPNDLLKVSSGKTGYLLSQYVCDCLLTPAESYLNRTLI